MSFLSEFKAFAVRGNVVDLAVGVIIGGAFGKIVASFVADVVMPPFGLAIGGVDFSKLQLVLQQSADPAKIVASATACSSRTPSTSSSSPSSSSSWSS